MFDKIIEDIRKEYTTSNNNIGWRFLTSSRKTLDENSGIYLITLNPGGNKINEKHDVESCENGSAYIVETWKDSDNPGESKLQMQFQKLFQELAIVYKSDDYRRLLEESVCGYFIPFRSPNYDMLFDKEKSIELGKGIWKRIIKNNPPKILICIDKVTSKFLKEILEELGYQSQFECDYLIGWGKYKATISTYIRENNKIKLVRFPHLSRYSIFGREKSREFINKIFEEIKGK